MNTVTKRAYILLFLIVAFLAGMGILTASFVLHGGTWATSKANGHLYSNGQITNAGKILDRDGVVLAQSVNGKRYFHQNRAIRVSTLHAVGDTYGYIATGAHTLCRDKLTGYSRIDGLNKLLRSGEGSDVTLTIDAGLCVTAHEALGSNKGTVGVYNYKTAEIVCMTSNPSFDPENKPFDIDVNPVYEGVYLNRLLTGVFTPGSTFKVITAASMLEKMPSLASETFNCSGSYNVGGSSIKCQNTYGHGSISFDTAFAQSCNSAFAQIGLRLGADNLISTAKSAGFGKSFNVSGVNTAISKFSLSSSDDDVALGWTSVGQGETLANPLHMMMIMGAIANSGATMTPTFVKDSAVAATVNSAKQHRFFSEATANELKKYMRNNVMTNYGDSRFPGMEFCGKTGTAEVNGEQSHAWFVGFSLKPGFPYAIVVCVQNGGGGSAVAIPIASAVMQKLATRSYAQ